MAWGVRVCSVRAQRNPDDHVTSAEQADAWIGRIGLDSAGRKIGKITRVWVDDYSGLPTWATLESGRFDRREGIAPLSAVTATGGRPQLACTKAEVMSAPRVDDYGHLGLDDEWRLINHYKLAATSDPTRQDPAGELPNSARIAARTRTRFGHALLVRQGQAAVAQLSVRTKGPSKVDRPVGCSSPACAAGSGWASRP